MARHSRGKHLVHGVGINDVAAPTEWRENGKRVKDPYYKLWLGIIRRCYDLKKQEKSLTYIGCTVHSDWHTFSRFKEWVNRQPQTDWRDLYIDKDLLIKGNKVYGPGTCCFLTSRENSMFRPSLVKLGNSFKKSGHRKKPWCCKTGYNAYVGYCSTKEEAEIVAFQASLKSVIEVANANPHQFIREAMWRWIADWKNTLLVMKQRMPKTETLF